MTAFLKKFTQRISILTRLPKGTLNFLLASLSYIFRLTYIFGLPVNATIELTNLCGLKCPVCETGAGVLKRKKGSMSFDNYRMIIDQIAPFTNTVLLYFMGEPLNNKSIYEVIRYTKTKNIYVKICTNGQNIDPVRLIESGLDEIQFQIGGITQDTHSVYRVGSDLSEVLRNVRLLTGVKKNYIEQGKVAKTKICLGLIVMKQNENELKDFFRMAEELGVDDARVEVPCVRSLDQGRLFLPKDMKYWLYNPEAFKKGVLVHKDYRADYCKWIYYSITVTWEGDVIPCCRDVDGMLTMGNLLQEKISAIWNNRRFRVFRKKVLNKAEVIPMCLLCDGLTFPSMEKI